MLCSDSSYLPYCLDTYLVFRSSSRPAYRHRIVALYIPRYSGTDVPMDVINFWVAILTCVGESLFFRYGCYLIRSNIRKRELTLIHTCIVWFNHTVLGDLQCDL